MNVIYIYMYIYEEGTFLIISMAIQFVGLHAALHFSFRICLPFIMWINFWIKGLMKYNIYVINSIYIICILVVITAQVINTLKFSIW